MKNEIIKFVNDELELEVNVSKDRENVWLSLNQMAKLFSKNKSTISRHIKNIFSEGELDEFSSVAKNATQLNRFDPRTGANRLSTVETNYYNLDVIISVGYRVNSKQGIIFRKWATSILKDYMLKGYAINQKRLDILNKTIDIQTKMLSSSLEIDHKEVLNVIDSYTNALSLLDDYDHQQLSKPKGNKASYVLTYKECRELIDKMSDKFDSAVFGVEKEKGKLEGIIASIYQTAFGQEVYPTIEEKAANLLYFLIKDHPFADGCKRIGACLFLEFLNKNKFLYKDNNKRISNDGLVAITLMIAQSNPSEKDVMVKLLMNLLSS